jgi:hypothetical protein
MAKRDDVVPEDLLLHLRKKVSGFSSEPEKVQMALAKLVWIGASKRKQHKKHEGAMSFTYQELHKAFGKGKFAEINSRLNFFDVTPNWSLEQGTTKGYWFTPNVQAVRDSYFQKDWRKVTRVVMMDGSIQRTVPPAIGSRDSKGNMAKTWGGSKIAAIVRVDLPTLKNTRKWLNQRIKDWQEGRRPQDLFMEYPNEQYLQGFVDRVAKIIRMSQTDVAGHGCIVQRYKESPSGRLYGVGVTLQNAHSLIKEAALHGLWEYDFSNCHYSIIEQMASREGFDCKAIQHYLANKSEVREAIATDVQITVEQAKTCLVAILYGAKASLRPDDAIPNEIGIDAAIRLYEHPLFKAIKDDVGNARSTILKAWPRTGNGNLTNACGKSIKADESSHPEKLAHLLQGVEASALKAVFDAYPGEIVLLQHDGFTSYSRLDLKPMEELVYQATGYRLYLELKQIRLTPERQFLKVQNANRKIH